MTTETYLASDGNEEIEIDATSHADAAQQYVDTGEWGYRLATTWVLVSTLRAVDRYGDEDDWPWETTRVTLDPIEPECSGHAEHEWAAPHEIVGGLEENPGVWGHGGGIVMHEVCVRCGCGRTTDTWAQDMADGTQGLRAVEYEPGRYAEAVTP